MRIVFCIYDFTFSNLPLQPWMTILKVAEGLARRGHTIHIITDATQPFAPSGVSVHSVRSLRGSHAPEMGALLATLAPEALVYLPTPLNLVTTRWLDKLRGCRRIGFASYPFYNFSELARAWRRLPLASVKPYIRHLLVPSISWRAAGHHRCEAIIVQSRTTAERLERSFATSTPVHTIAPGIDLGNWPWRPAEDHGGTVQLVYMGAVRAVRGFEVAMEAMSRLPEESDISLRVLARGADEATLEEIETAILRRNIQSRITVIGGWIDREELVREIHNADAVLQPFVLVPSELPVTAMEVIACGTPVIGSAIDGMPSTIGPAGAVTRQGCPVALADLIVKFSHDYDLRRAWRDGCIVQRAAMLDWDSITLKWEEVLRG